MRCPYCGDRRTEVLKTVYRGRSSYRHRQCLYCGSRFSTQERPVRWSRVDRKWPGPRPLRKGWGTISLSLPAYARKQIGRPHSPAVALEVRARPLPTKILDSLKYRRVQSQGRKSAK